MNSLIKYVKTKRSFLCDLSVFLLIFLTSSYSITSDIFPSLLTIALWLFLFVIQLALLKTNTANRLIYLFLALALSIIVSTFVNSDDFKGAIKLLFSFVVAFLLVVNYKKKDLVESFIHIIRIISFISLIGFFLFLFVEPPSFSLVSGLNGKYYYHFILYNHMAGSYRNASLFWEPGAFATFLILAILALFSKESFSKWTFTLFVICLLTTFSTTGFIACVPLFLILLLSNHFSRRSKWVLVLIVIAIISFALVFLKDYLFGNDASSVFGKIRQFYELQEYSGEQRTSASIRYFAIIKPFEIFLSKPLFGVGYTTLIADTFYFTHGATTCTFVNWFAIYGVLFGALLLIGLLRLSFSKRNFFIGLLFLITILLAIISEDFSRNAFVFGACLLGYVQTAEKKENRVLFYGKQSCVLQ